MDINLYIKKLSTKYRYLVATILIAFLGVVLFGSYFGYLYSTTNGYLRHPAIDHYHFRTQMEVDGVAVDFAGSDFQEEYDHNSCSADLDGDPIDFHDSEDQMTHIHWSGVTGGDFLKYFGWNLTGGEDGTLGTRFDQGFMSMHKVPIHGDIFPTPAENDNYYIYTGDENNYQKRDWNEFLNSDFEDFFGKKSYLNKDYGTSFNILDLLTAKTYAQGTVSDGHSTDTVNESVEEKLTRINNLLGNIVIFVQEQEPTDEQILAKFQNLQPLTDSVCGG